MIIHISQIVIKKFFLACSAKFSYLSSWEMMMNFSPSGWYMKKQPKRRIIRNNIKFHVKLFKFFFSTLCLASLCVKAVTVGLFIFILLTLKKAQKLNSSKLNCEVFSSFRLLSLLDKQWNNNNKFILQSTRELEKITSCLYIYFVGESFLHLTSTSLLKCLLTSLEQLFLILVCAREKHLQSETFLVAVVVVHFGFINPRKLFMIRS